MLAEDVGLSAVEAFIADHGMHASTPVDLDAIRDLYEIQLLPLSDATMGVAFVNEAGGVIGVNASLHPYEQRMVVAHECSHFLLCHPNSLYLCRMNDWWYYRVEMEAQRAAAMLLLPAGPLATMAIEGASLAEMQESFRVPSDLIRLRLKMALPHL